MDWPKEKIIDNKITGSLKVKLQALGTKTPINFNNNLI